MASLTVRNLDEELVKQLRIRAAQKGRSAEAEHREILRLALRTREPEMSREEAIERLAAFRQSIAGRGGPSSAELLAESREARMQKLSGSHDT
jgi:plasmid stability protein